MAEEFNITDNSEIIKHSAEEVMAKFDKESRTRTFTGAPKWIIRIMLISFAIYLIFSTLFYTFPTQIARSLFMAFILLFTFLIYPASRKANKRPNYIPWYDYILAIIGFCGFMYWVFFYKELVYKATNIVLIDKIIAVITFATLIEACRRVTGIPIIIVSLCFILYALIDGFSYTRIIHQLFYTTEGIIGTPVGVCTTFIALFIIFGALLEKSQIGAFFVNLSNSLVGAAAGGPAKVAVISSALMGMYSGSSVANTVGSGSVTIPLMKKTGYKPEFAAAVEAAASTGGQIMPPIMGAAAFLMSEITGVPYISIIIAAILPALLYFTGIFVMVHFEAKKLGLNGLPKDTLPNFFKLIAKSGYLLLPVVILVICMNFFTAAYSACIAIASTIIVSLFSKETRLTPIKLAESLESGVKSTIGVAIACAIAGTIVGIVTLTGLGQTMISVLMSISKNEFIITYAPGLSIFIALFMTMIACIILGMGVPTTANYVIMATITAPMLVKMGIPLLASHMFVFYFGIVADITPPVALAAYAGSAIAGSKPMKTALNATRLAIAAFIIPYIFALSPDMLIIGAAPLNVVLIIVTSLIGIFAISAGLEGYMFKKLRWFEILCCIIGGLVLIIPGWQTDIIGVVLVTATILMQRFLKTKSNKLEIN